MLRRVLRGAGNEELLEVLGERVPGADLQSLLLEVYARRAATLAPGDVARQAQSNRLVRPSTVPPARMLAFDQLALATLPPEFEALELSPLSALGATSVLARLSQDQAVATARNVEVCSDPTNTLALEAAVRRRGLLKASPRSTERVRLATSHRVVRPQKIDLPAAWNHFRLLGLVTAGRDQGSRRCEAESLVEQIRAHVDVLAACRERGFRFTTIRVVLSSFEDAARHRFLDELVGAPLAAEYPDVVLESDHQRESGRAYYHPWCFQVHVAGDDGEEYFLSDGGTTDWTQRLLGDRKERLLISGMGSERLVHCLAPES